MITALILVGLVVDLGGGPDHDRRGFRVSVLWSCRRSHLNCIFLQYWNDPGAFNQMGLEPTKLNLDRFLAIMSSIVQAAFGFSGIEIVSPSWFPVFGCYRLLKNTCFRSPCKDIWCTSIPQDITH